MKLVTLDGPPRVRPGVLLDNEALDLDVARELHIADNWTYDSIVSILQAGAPALDEVRRIVEQVVSGGESQSEQLRARNLLRPVDQVPFLAPVPQPRLIISAGNNYSSHSREMGGAVPSQPTGFIKASGCVVGPGHPIILPPEAANMVDYEGELCLIFGKSAYRVRESEALSYVAGYLCGNDISARDWVGAFDAWMKDPASKRYEAFSDPGQLNLRYKNFPTFMPCGPALVTADEISDPHGLWLRTLVNGEIRQDSNTADLTFGLPELIAYWSRVFAFEPGDMMTTGSPPGVGVARQPPVFLRAGDVVTVEIERLGHLTNPVANLSSSG